MTSGGKWGYIVSIIIVFILSTLISGSLQTSLNSYSWLVIILITVLLVLLPILSRNMPDFFP